MPQKVRKGEELTEANLQHFLHQHQLIDTADEALNISQFSNGFSNLTYLIEAGNRAYVLRRPPFGAIKRGHDMGREFKVLSNLNKAFSKAPVAYAYTEDLHHAKGGRHHFDHERGEKTTSRSKRFSNHRQ